MWSVRFITEAVSNALIFANNLAVLLNCLLGLRPQKVLKPIGLCLKDTPYKLIIFKCI